MKRGVLTFGGNTINVWIKMAEGEIRASSARPKESISFQKFADKYIAEAIPNFKPASQSSLKSNIAALTPFFGTTSLAAIDTEKIQSYVASCTGVAPKTIKNRLGTMKMVWRRARAWGYADGNPFEFVSLPRAELKEAKFLSVDEVRSIIRATSGEFNMMLRILAETGCRGGELVALTKSDIDLDARIIRIRRSAFQGKLQTPKTGNAVRTIAISRALAQTLRAAVDGKGIPSMRFDSALGLANGASSEARMLDSGSTPDARNPLLFPYKGNPWNNGEIVRRLKPVLGTGVGLHAFRHANISLMASLGVPLHIQKERIGHASGDITARYTHSSPEDHKKYAEIIGQALCTENGLARAMGAD